MLDLKRNKGVWDGKRECDLAFTTIMWIECSFVFYSNTNDTRVVQIEKYEKHTLNKFITSKLFQPSNIGKTLRVHVTC